MTFQVLDPTPEKTPAVGQLAPRLPSLEVRTIGFISNGKEGTKGFFRYLDQLLCEEYGVARVSPDQVELQRAGRRAHRGRDPAMGCRHLRHWRLRQLLNVQSARLRHR